MEAAPEKVAVQAVRASGTTGVLSLKSIYIKQGRENWKGLGLWGGELVGMKWVAEPSAISEQDKVPCPTNRMLPGGAVPHVLPEFA